jgi:ATP-dependent Zn protease
LALQEAFTFEEDPEDGVLEADQAQALETMIESDIPRRGSCLGDADFDAEVRRLQRRAVTLVRRHRRAVERVAAALLERRRLSGDEVKALIDQA